jgi:protein phosphatase
MAIPLILLYEVGILGVRFFGKNKNVENQEMKEKLIPIEQVIGHITITGISDIGKVRLKNQDVFGIFPEMGLAIVADGMSGRPAGEVASKMAMDTLYESLLNESKMKPYPLGLSSLGNAITDANQKVYDAAEQNLDYHGMATTVVAVLANAAETLIGFSGDSRVYLHRSGVLTQITMDHSVVNEYIRVGVITPEEAEHHPLRHVISRGVGVEQTIFPETLKYPAEPGDLFLLCTDGLSNMMKASAICEVLTKNRKNLSLAVSMLIEGAKDAGGKDNITVILIRYD